MFWQRSEWEATIRIYHHLAIILAFKTNMQTKEPKTPFYYTWKIMLTLEIRHLLHTKVWILERIVANASTLDF